MSMNSVETQTGHMPNPPVNAKVSTDLNEAIAIFEQANKSVAATASQVKTVLSIMSLISRETQEATIAGFLFAKGYKTEVRKDKEYFIFQ